MLAALAFSSSNIIKLMTMVCQEFVFGLEKEVGRRERRKGKEFMGCWIRIRMEFRILNFCTI